MKNVVRKVLSMGLCEGHSMSFGGLIHFNFSLSVMMILMLTVLASCRKNSISEDVLSTEKMKVTLRVSQFEQMPFEKAIGTKAELSSVCSRITFARFEEGAKEDMVTQEIGDEGFGTFQMDLTEGDHKIVILAHNGDANPTIPTSLTSDALNISFSNKDCRKVTDTFLYFGTITVSKENTEFDIDLKRVTSMFRFTIDDAIPENMCAIQFEVKGVSSSLNTKTLASGSKGGQTEVIPIKEGNKTFEIYSFPYADQPKYEITISALDAKNRPCKILTLNDVPLTRNVITKYHGEFFKGGCLSYQELDFPLRIDDVWTESSDVLF